MIVTLTVNPALDRAVTLSGPLRPGEVQTARSTREDAGGKGINVTRVIAAAGGETLAVLPLDDEDPFAAALRAAHVPSLAVAVHGAARANLTIADGEGRRPRSIFRVSPAPTPMQTHSSPPSSAQRQRPRGWCSQAHCHPACRMTSTSV